MTPKKVTYFRTPADFRKWLAVHHRSARELWVGFHKKSSGTPSITWPESVDEALCAGWIDGIRKSIDDDRYTIRFTPRRRGSIWSAVNIKRVSALRREKRMLPAGLEAFKDRRENRSGIYAYEQRRDRLEEPYAGMMKKHKPAWEFFEAQPPGYRKVIGWWIVSARQEETRLKRLATLVEASARGQRIR
jgi:uncharacterized protein YdeI (YjbR/CyaY-like superfamily)